MSTTNQRSFNWTIEVGEAGPNFVLTFVGGKNQTKVEVTGWPLSFALRQLADAVLAVEGENFYNEWGSITGMTERPQHER